MSITWKSESWSGAIIDENWLVTSGQRCVDVKPGDLKVRAGSERRNKGGSVHQVDRVVVHERMAYFIDGVYANDICLMHVKNPFNMDKTRQKIDLFNAGETAPVGKMAKVSGFGWVRGDEYPKEMQTVEVPVINTDFCALAYGNKVDQLPKGLICAGYWEEGGKNACVGDDGAPLVLGGRLAGVVSHFHLRCGEPHHPVIYTDVGYHREWINQRLEAFS